MITVRPRGDARPTRRGNYPHTVALHVDPEQYEWLHTEARRKRLTVSELIRVILTHAETHDYE